MQELKRIYTKLFMSVGLRWKQLSRNSLVLKMFIVNLVSMANFSELDHSSSPDVIC